MKYFSNEALTFSLLEKVLALLYFGSCQNCMSSVNLVAKIYQKLCNKRTLSTGEPCTCEYITLLQSLQMIRKGDTVLARPKMQECQNFLKKKIQCFTAEIFYILFSHTHTHTHTKHFWFCRRYFMAETEGVVF